MIICKHFEYEYLYSVALKCRMKVSLVFVLWTACQLHEDDKSDEDMFKMNKSDVIAEAVVLSCLCSTVQPETFDQHT